jgi:hypothetical protein
MSDQDKTKNMKLIMDRIRIVLAMTESPNEAEAATAMEMAHKMLKEHNLTLSDLEFGQQAIIEDVYETYQRIPAWKERLLGQIMRSNYCEAYHHIRYNGHGHNGVRFDSTRDFMIVGRQENVATARAMADYLVNAVERLAKKFKGETSEKKSYKYGISETLRIRLATMMEKEEVETAETTALMIKENALVKKHMDEKENLKQGKSTSLKIEDLMAYLQGEKDGNNISLNKQVEEGAKASVSGYLS